MAAPSVARTKSYRRNVDANGGIIIRGITASDFILLASGKMISYLCVSKKCHESLVSAVWTKHHQSAISRGLQLLSEIQNYRDHSLSAAKGRIKGHVVEDSDAPSGFAKNPLLDELLNLSLIDGAANYSVASQVIEFGYPQRDQLVPVAP